MSAERRRRVEWCCCRCCTPLGHCISLWTGIGPPVTCFCVKVLHFRWLFLLSADEWQANCGKPLGSAPIFAGRLGTYIQLRSCPGQQKRQAKHLRSPEYSPATAGDCSPHCATRS